jgi:uncharacterized protein (TIGR02246 family)
MRSAVENVAALMASDHASPMTGVVANGTCGAIVDERACVARWREAPVQAAAATSQLHINKGRTRMPSESSNVTNEAQIRALIEAQVTAVHAKDIDGLMTDHAPDLLSFNVVDPLRYIGLDAVKQRAEAWFSSFQGSIGYEMRDLSVTAGDDVAFCHYLYRVSGTQTGGANVDMWVRATVCCRKIDGTWSVVHEHTSVPFDPDSGKASLDLKP